MNSTRQIHYLCDPAKNTTCSKKECFRKGGDCCKTANIAFAQDCVEVIETKYENGVITDVIHFEPKEQYGIKQRV